MQPLTEDDAPRKKCPDCAELIVATAKKCHFCGWTKRPKILLGPPQQVQPGLAVALSFLLMGAGHFYVGRWKRALAFYAGLAGCVGLIALGIAIQEQSGRRATWAPSRSSRSSGSSA